MCNEVEYISLPKADGFSFPSLSSHCLIISSLKFWSFFKYFFY